MQTIPPPKPYLVTLFRSTFRRRWYGVLLNGAPNGCGDFVIIKDARGRPMQRRIVKRLSFGWIERAGKIDPSTINPDWLKPIDPNAEW